MKFLMYQLNWTNWGEACRFFTANDSECAIPTHYDNYINLY